MEFGIKFFLIIYTWAVLTGGQPVDIPETQKVIDPKTGEVIYLIEKAGD